MDNIQEMAKRGRREIMQHANQLTVGELIDLLEPIKPKTIGIKFDFGDTHPTGFDSYRGYYEDLAIGFTDEGERWTVAKFLMELHLCLSEEFTGYKGGSYRMTRDTPLYVANFGNTGGCGVVGIAVREHYVILQTAIVDPLHY